MARNSSASLQDDEQTEKLLETPPLFDEIKHCTYRKLKGFLPSFDSVIYLLASPGPCLPLGIFVMWTGGGWNSLTQLGRMMSSRGCYFGRCPPVAISISTLSRFLFCFLLFDDPALNTKSASRH
jgi:hypothetical protein